MQHFKIFLSLKLLNLYLIIYFYNIVNINKIDIIKQKTRSKYNKIIMA